MEENARYKSIIAIIIIIIVSIGLLSWIMPTLSDQNNSGTQTVSVSQTKTDSSCLTAAETWSNIGKKTCVIFYPEKFARSGDYFFIDEKEDYTNGFVVFIGKKGLISWDSFLAKYKVGKKLKVSGTIERYNGYPQIKVYSLDQITVVK